MEMCGAPSTFTKARRSMRRPSRISSAPQWRLISKPKTRPRHGEQPAVEMPVSASRKSGKMRLLEIPMRKNDLKLIAFFVLVQLCLPAATLRAQAQAEKAAYPAMAPVDAYLI